MKDECCII